jgi:hypothetical protein
MSVKITIIIMTISAATNDGVLIVPATKIVPVMVTALEIAGACAAAGRGNEESRVEQWTWGRKPSASQAGHEVTHEATPGRTACAAAPGEAPSPT